MPYVKIRSTIGTPPEYRHFPEPLITLGRDRHSDIVLEGRLVSRRHAQLRMNGEAWFLSDLGSRNGTRLNGKKIEQGTPMKLTPGDEIQIGRSVVFFGVEDEATLG